MSLHLSHEIFIEAAVPPAVTASALGKLIASALTAETATGSWHVELVLGDDALLHRLHWDFMGLDSPTDIMTFPDHDTTEAPDHPKGGQIYISVERAAAQATELGQTLTDEIRFLVLHGLLHLCGWNDESEPTRAAMLARQTELLREFERAGG